jgi:hypothetical protein
MKIKIFKLIKVKNDCSTKYLAKKRKRQITKWIKVFANHVSRKGILFRIY